MIGFIGLTTYKRDGFGFRIPEFINSVALSSGSQLEAVPFGKGCFLGERLGYGKCDNVKRPLVFLWGDSHAGALFPGLKWLQEKKSFGIAEFSLGGGCKPFFWTHDAVGFCQPMNDEALAQATASKPEIVLLHSIWGKGDEPLLISTIVKLKGIGLRRIILVGPVPRWYDALPRVLFTYFRHYQRIPPARIQFGLQTSLDNQRQFDETMRSLAENNGIEYISALNVFCNQEGCLTRFTDEKKGLTTIDSNHLSVAGSKYFADKYSTQLFSSSQ